MRYFLDTEYNGWGGALLSLALVAESGDELYLRIAHDGPLEPWVERHVLPYFDTVPENLRSPPLSRVAAADTLAHFLESDDEPLILADWPEDIAQLAMLFVVGPGQMANVPPVRFELLIMPGFSTAANSAVPHNALHDARALREHWQHLYT